MFALTEDQLNGGTCLTLRHKDGEQTHIAYCHGSKVYWNDAFMIEKCFDLEFLDNLENWLYQNEDTVPLRLTLSFNNWKM